MSPPHPTVPLPVDGLAALAEVVEHRLDLEGEPPPLLLRVRVVADEVELGWLPLGHGRHPVDELLCTEAPPGWCAVGVAAPGRARPVDDPSVPPVAVRTVHLVGRDGAWASRWGPPGRSEAAAGGPDHPDRPVGRVDDVCRRALGLPTGAPPASTALLWSSQWLDAVVDLALGSPGGPPGAGWAAVASLHPAVRALHADGPADLPTPAALAGLARRLSSWRCWSGLRRACAAGTWADAPVEPEVAAWLDDGAFARWVLGAYPELDDLREIVAGILHPSVAGAVETVLAAGAADSR